MKQIFEQEPQEFVRKLADKLKELPEIQAPEWAAYVKTGMSKQRPPEQEDFWQLRTASILRQLYIKGVVGVNRLRTRYGSRKNRGSAPARFKKASGKIIRVILQQCEQAGLVEKLSKRQFGRRLTAKGREFLDSIKTTPAEPFTRAFSEEKQKIIAQEDESAIEEESE